jgi:ribulose-5-phosphate 4-epimerase/fuculose-1-phosphate aldolase
MSSVLERSGNRISESTSIRNKVSPEEWAVRVDLAAAHRFAVLEGWQEPYSIFNHFAARVPGEPNCMLIKPHDLLFSEVTASNLVKLDMKGKALGFADNINAAGFAIHSAVLLARPDVNATTHIHGKAGMAIVALKDGLMFCNQEAMRFYNRIGYHDFEGVAAMDECERLARDLGKHNALILRSHGLLTCGPTVGAATLDLGLLVRCCEAQLQYLSTGKPLILPSPEVCEQTAQFTEKGDRRPEGWNAARRYIDRLDPTYAE